MPRGKKIIEICRTYAERKEETNMGLPGVFMARKKDHSVYYRSSITVREKHISLGSYPTELEAHLAYKEARMVCETDTVGLADYTEDSLLSFSKWVVLVNYRDNGLYFAMPIYLKNKYFLYYLSPSHCLKFDIDDLFYYSSKKIMCRGGRLFVNDYGMQCSILNRYGIKNYAVCGKDYRFINGDATDFRYENIEVLNRFHGLSCMPAKDRSGFLYKVRIHVRSSYVVGVYKEETEAAIAYNKAADILKKNGINRNFAQNYIEGLSPAVYADIYSKLQISPAIFRLTPENT